MDASPRSDALQPLYLFRDVRISPTRSLCRKEVGWLVIASREAKLALFSAVTFSVSAMDTFNTSYTLNHNPA